MCGLLPSPRRPRQPLPSQGRRRDRAASRACPAAVTVPLSDDSRLAVEIRTLVEAGDLDAARERFEGLVVTHQRRAVRIAYQYLRDAAEADEAVQDAFVKVFSHIGSYREAWPFEVWFTRILINGCLDRRKARVRRERWLVPSPAEDIEDIAAGSPRREWACSAVPRRTRTPKHGCSRVNGGRA